MITVSNVVSDCQKHFPDMKELRCLQLLNEVHIDLIEELRLVPDTTITIPLVAGQLEYPMTNVIISIWEAAYIAGEGQYDSIEQTSIDELDIRSRGWRSGNETGQPMVCYYRGGNVGLWPVPDTTSDPVSGYPNVQLFVSELTSQLGINSNLPATVATPNAYVYEICSRYAAQTDKSQVEFFAPLAKKEKLRMINRDYRVMPRDQPKLVQRVPRIRY